MRMSSIATAALLGVGAWGVLGGSAFAQASSGGPSVPGGTYTDYRGHYRDRYGTPYGAPNYYGNSGQPTPAQQAPSGAAAGDASAGGASVLGPAR